MVIFQPNVSVYAFFLTKHGSSHTDKKGGTRKATRGVGVAEKAGRLDKGRGHSRVTTFPKSTSFDTVRLCDQYLVPLTYQQVEKAAGTTGERGWGEEEEAEEMEEDKKGRPLGVEMGPCHGTHGESKDCVASLVRVSGWSAREHKTCLCVTWLREQGKGRTSLGGGGQREGGEGGEGGSLVTLMTR